MNSIKSAAFLIFLATWSVLSGLLGTITFLSFNRKIISRVGYLWAMGGHLYLKYICGVKIKIEGEENVPKAPFIIVCKHQSAWETLFFLIYFAHLSPSYVLKKELTYIPVYGWYLPILGMISIERGKASAIKKLSLRVKEVIAQKRALIIFPEGTRSAPGESVDYKPGIYIIHKASPETPIVPVALNSGKIWPRKTFAVNRGTIHIKFLPPLKGHFEKAELLEKLKKIIDEESNKL
ncbi:MAG: 1-acyl-sn-glycerol-3-phosphate acyltransferase [Candidatus Midichloriaceae bacterium]|jgi:1-acyl-sn-glycerol-3-phosphate acyltransferase|nr:1-acyl-sn-glycerol-3-phosphate acyltransferase [Candidatus Midichloriaceae bacterium]